MIYSKVRKLKFMGVEYTHQDYIRILTICPTKYPNKLKKMVNSFIITHSKPNHLIWEEEGTVTECFNNIFNKHPDYDFYFMANDDIEFNTPLWDLKLSNKGKISYGDDGIQDLNLPTFPMIDGDIVRALGWLQLPSLNKYCGDLVWKFIGQELNILNYVPEVKITHKWEGCADALTHTKDMEEFAKWLPNAYKDVNKVKEILNATKN